MEFRAGSGRLAISLVVSAALLLSAPPASAQRVAFTPRADRPLERDLEAFLDRGGWTLLSADTVLEPDSRVGRDLLVLEAVVRIAGQVEGDVYVVDGDLFLRPGARIAGDVVVLGGGYYGSSLAEVEGRLEYRPTDAYRVLPRDGGFYIYAVERVPDAFELDGLYGFHAPTYQRTDEWTLAWGATGRAVDVAWQPSLSGVIRYRTQQRDLGWTLRQLWYPTGRVSFGFLVERDTRTNDEWIRGDLSNTLAFLVAGEDYRNYYRSDRAALVVAGSREQVWTPSLRVQWEEAESLRAHDLGALFEDDAPRPNPAVDEGEIVSAAFAVGIQTRTGSTRLRTEAGLEGADASVAGDFSFLMGRAWALWEGPAPFGHRLELFGIARGDLAGSLPRQRWSAMGGAGTLPKFPILALRGERLVFARATYLVPVWPLDLGPLGVPELFLRGALGAVWSSGDPAPFQQNLSLGVRALLLEAAVVVDPGAPEFEPELFLMATLPGDL